MNAPTTQTPIPSTGAPITPPPRQPQGMQPPSVLLQGASGAGKTRSIATLIKAGIEVFVIGTEPGYTESLVDGIRALNADMNRFHYATAMPVTEGFAALDEMTNKIGTMNFEQLSKLQGVGKEQTRKPAMDLLLQLKDFKDERTGTAFGSFVNWGPDRALVVDSLSGLSTIAWYLTVGHKPTGAPGEWNIAMNWIEAVLMKINSDRRCWFILTAHVEKEIDEISGVNRIMTSTLGRKLAPKIPRFFSEVVYAKRTTEEPKFRWSTIDAAADLKNRGLPVGDKLLPDFKPLVDAFNARLKLATV